MPEDVIRPSARFTGPLKLRCSCGDIIAVRDAADPLICPACGERWRLTLTITEHLPGADGDGAGGAGPKRRQRRRE